MSDYDRRPTTVYVEPVRSGGGLYLLVGAVMAAVLIGVAWLDISTGGDAQPAHLQTK